MKRYRALFARDLASASCEPLIEALDQVLVHLSMTSSGSLEDAEAVLRAEPFDLVFVCLDLHPAPTAGVRLATSAIELQPAVVLVTRSLRWLPMHAKRLHRLPWLAPEAGPTEVAAMLSALPLSDAADLDEASSASSALARLREVSG